MDLLVGTYLYLEHLLFEEKTQFFVLCNIRAQGKSLITNYLTSEEIVMIQYNNKRQILLIIIHPMELESVMKKLYVNSYYRREFFEPVPVVVRKRELAVVNRILRLLLQQLTTYLYCNHATLTCCLFSLLQLIVFKKWYILAFSEL